MFIQETEQMGLKINDKKQNTYTFQGNKTLGLMELVWKAIILKR
jgi:hypothetical protein